MSAVEMRYVQAVAQALRDSLEADERVMVLGEDIAAAGGSFKATRGLLESFGPQRVLDTPISEASIVSAAVGAALTGMRPVVEIMFMDFITLAMDALVNQAAKARFMFGGQGSVPMVLRTPHGLLSMFTTLTTFGTPRDVTLDELCVELFYPSDAASEALLRGVAG